MRTGTPGFVGARLREARESRGLTATTVADLVGVTRAAISQYELGERTPSPATLTLISNVLRFPNQFFARTSAERGDNVPVFFRSQSSATKTARIQASWRLKWIEDVTEYLEEFVDLPNSRLPEIQGVAPKVVPPLLGFDAIEEIAQRLRDYLGLGDGPITNLTWLLENIGAVIGVAHLDTLKLDAASRKDSRHRLFTVLNAEKRTAVRWRFDLAHELGHAVLHWHLDEPALKEHFKLVEAQAHRFAAAFLVPADSLRDDFYSIGLDSFVPLKQKWRASVRMLIKRAYHVGLIDEDIQRRLYIGCSRRRWVTSEPLDDEIKVETPVLLRRSLEMIVGERLQSRERLLAGLGFYPADLESLTCLPPGLFREEAGVVELSRAPRPKPRGSGGPIGGGMLVKFPTRNGGD